MDENGNHAEYNHKEYLPTEEFVACKQINYNREEKEIKELNYSISPDYKNLIDKNNFYLNKANLNILKFCTIFQIQIILQ